MRSRRSIYSVSYTHLDVYKRQGEEILPEEVDKTFSLSGAEMNSKFQILVQDIPMEHIALGEEIISQARSRLGKKLNDMVYISDVYKRQAVTW